MAALIPVDSPFDIPVEQVRYLERNVSLTDKKLKTMTDSCDCFYSQGSDITVDGLTHLKKIAPNLRILNLACGHGIGDTAVEKIAELWAETLEELNLQSARNDLEALESLGIGTCRIRPEAKDKVENITDKGVVTLLTNCQKLKKIDLTHLRTLRGESINAIAQHRQLEWVGLTHTSGKGLQELREMMRPDLTVVLHDSDEYQDPTKSWEAWLEKGGAQFYLDTFAREKLGIESKK